MMISRRLTVVYLAIVAGVVVLRSIPCILHVLLAMQVAYIVIGGDPWYKIWSGRGEGTGRNRRDKGFGSRELESLGKNCNFFIRRTIAEL